MIKFHCNILIVNMLDYQSDIQLFIKLKILQVKIFFSKFSQVKKNSTLNLLMPIQAYAGQKTVNSQLNKAEPVPAKLII